MEYIKQLLSDKRLYMWLAGLVIAGASFIFVIDTWVMPAYTNYNEGVTIPDVTKVSLDEAQELLERSGLRYEVLDRRSNSIFPADYILDQTPEAQQIVKPNRKVYLTVNTAVKPTVVVPNLIGLSERNALIHLENWGLASTGPPSYERGEYNNSIMRQSIPAGDTVAVGTEIHLTVGVNVGERMVPIPDVAGLSLSEAQRRVENAGLVVSEITYQSSRDAEPNTILSISPTDEENQAETEIREGEEVRLVVAEKFDLVEEEEAGAVITGSAEELPSNESEDSPADESDGENTQENSEEN